jgi:hypothetical protein
MADYDLDRLLRLARSGTLADNDPQLQTLRRHAASSVPGAAAKLSEVTNARTGSGGGDVNKVM